MIGVRIPKMGMSTIEVDILAVRVAVGRQVTPDTVVVEVGAEKANYDIEAGVAGTVTHVLVQEGDIAKVGDVVVRIKP